jgi:hypothetical protein
MPRGLGFATASTSAAFFPRCESEQYEEVIHEVGKLPCDFTICPLTAGHFGGAKGC